MSFWRCTSANITIMAAVSLPALLVGVGVALDTANIIHAKSRLQNVLDAAVLAASEENATDEQRKALFARIVSARTGEFLADAPIATLDVDDGINYVKLTGRLDAHVPLFLMDRLGDQKITVSATSFRSTKTLEIVMVLDNTGSMGQAGIDALKRASKALVAAVDNNGDPRQEIKVGVVPFVTAVNIRAEGFKWEWIDRKGEALYNGWNFISDAMRTSRSSQTAEERRADLTDTARDQIVSQWAHLDGTCAAPGRDGGNADMVAMCAAMKTYPHHEALFQASGTTWKGCVEARPAPYNLDLTPPDPNRPDTLFVPFFAPSEPAARMTRGGNDGARFNNAWLDHKTRDLSLATTADQHKIQRSPLKYVTGALPDANKRPTASVSDAPNLTIGPNRACPTPLTPLTTDMAKVRKGIDAMQFWNGSGTNISEGLAWGWRLLSPGEPFDQAAPFTADHVSKFMILMSDGTNVSFGSSGTINKSDYGSYGFLGAPSDGRAGSRIEGTTTQGAAETALNTYTAGMCTRMKAQGVEVFTVLYNTTNAAVQKLFRECASRPTNFYAASNTAALEASFAKIGTDVASLHLTQ